MWLILIILVLLHESVECKMIPYIEGGSTTKIKHFPHSVFLVMNCRVDFFCGGSILNEILILTAAHCLANCNTRSKMLISYGDENIDLMNSVRVRHFKMHPHYDSQECRNDIGMVLSEKRIPFGRNVKRVAVLRSPPSFERATVTGWGVINGQMQETTKLKKTDQKLQPPSICSSLVGEPSGTFCAGPVRGSGNPTEGDSGGALVVKNYIQVGIVSYKVEKYRLTVYTNVSYHYNWISAAARSFGCYKL